MSTSNELTLAHYTSYGGIIVAFPGGYHSCQKVENMQAKVKAK
jgi:hypothetical protein